MRVNKKINENNYIINNFLFVLLLFKDLIYFYVKLNLMQLFILLKKELSFSYTRAK